MTLWRHKVYCIVLYCKSANYPHECGFYSSKSQRWGQKVGSNNAYLQLQNTIAQCTQASTLHLYLEKSSSCIRWHEMPFQLFLKFPNSHILEVARQPIHFQRSSVGKTPPASLPSWREVGTRAQMWPQMTLQGVNDATVHQGYQVLHIWLCF